MGNCEGQTKTRVFIDRAAAVLTAHSTDWSKTWNWNNEWKDEWIYKWMNDDGYISQANNLYKGPKSLQK